MRTRSVVDSILAFLCVCLAVTSAAAERLDNWTYETDAHYLSDKYADKGGMLQDGQRGRSSTVIYRGDSVVINVALEEEATVQRIIVNVHRHNMNYKLSQLQVQALIGGHYEPAGSARGFWGPTETRDFKIRVELQRANTRKLRLVFNTDGILSISELAVFGEKQPKQGDGDDDLPFRDVSQPTVRERDLDGDGVPEILLENSRVGMAFYPAFGGICRTLYLKGAEFDIVTPGGPDQAMFRDQLWDPRYFFSDRHYHFETGGDDEAAWVELWTTGQGGILSFTKVRKRITLQKASNIIIADYSLSNDPSSQTDFVYGWWWHNFLGVKGQTNTYYFPTEDGVQELNYNPATAGEEIQGDHWYRNAARGWTAVRAETGPGMAIKVPYRYLNCFYAWIGAGYPVATLEWRYNRLKIKAGDSLDARIRILPFADLPRVDGCIDDAVGAIEIAEPVNGRGTANVTINLAATAKPLTADVGWRSSDDDEIDYTIADTTTIHPGATTTIEATTPQLSRGSYVINCRLSRDARVLGDFERPFSVGDARIVYHREPLMEREGLGEKESVAGLPRHDLSREIVTPHTRWANPLPDGPINALTLTGDRNAREIIELAQRMELEFTYVKFRTVLYEQWLYQGDRTIPDLEHAQRRLMKKLKDDYHLFLISGLKWDHHFTEKIRRRIIQQVRDGAGLVFIQPIGFTADEPPGKIMGVAEDRRNMNAFYRWHPAKEHYLTDALPWDIFPVTRRMEYKQWPQGTVVANCGEGEKQRPLMVTSSIGQGRVLAATWDVLTHRMSYRGYAGLTPILSYRGAWLRDQFSNITWNYHEHWYALLARACTWAAKRQSDVRITAIQAPDVKLGEEAEVRVTSSADGGGDYTAEITFRDRRSNTLATRRVDWQPDLTVAIPDELRSGLTLVDVIVRDASGASVGWGAAQFTVKAPVSIASVEVRNRTIVGEWSNGQQDVRRGRGWNSAHPYKARVKLNTTQSPTDDYRVRARLYDTHGRLLAEDVQKLPVDKAELQFTASPSEMRNMGLEWRIQLLRGDRIIDTDRARAVCVRPREYDTLHFQSWTGMYLWRSRYLWETVHRRVEKLGLDVSRYGGMELERGHVWNEYWHNRYHWFGGLLGHPPEDIPQFQLDKFGKIRAKWDKTGDRSLLARRPCINDPNWRDAMYQHLVERARAVQQFGGSHSYDTGDEMSLTHYRAYFDFCWSEHCLAKFRQRLKRKYDSLKNLNTIWDTDYETWDEPMPMTLEKARKADNPAPWADHRDFMATTMADFMKFVRKTVREVDPQARVGMSGTQAPRAGNGMDWWKMSGAFNHYISYNTAWSNEMRRSFQDDRIVNQAPYNAGYWRSGRSLEHGMWWCLLHDTVGIGAWTTHLFFYPDFTFSGAGRDTRDNLRELRSGIWAQVRQGERDDDGIALHYSHSSIRAAKLTNRIDELEGVRDAWVHLLEDIGLQYEFVSEQQIENGHLQNEGYRLVILPESLAVSDAQQQQIQRFVRAGGTVIADMRCGLRDSHCRKNDTPALDNLFGVTHGKPSGEPPAAKMTITEAIGEFAADIELKIAVPENNLRLDGATAMGSVVGEGGTPALVVNDAHDGHAIYLNLDLSQYEAERKFRSATEKVLRKVLLGLLSDAGIEPAYRLTFNSETTPHVEMVRYHLGEVTMLGLLRAYDDSASDETATVILPEPAFVYSMRGHKQLGGLREITVPMAPGQAALYCISPRELAPLRLSTARGGSAVPAGSTVSYRVSRSESGPPEVAHVTVRDPAGKRIDDYTQNVILRGDSAGGTIPLALNDEPGQWRITARSALSGSTATTSFQVRGQLR